jgi:hypothetical protein
MPASTRLVRDIGSALVLLLLSSGAFASESGDGRPGGSAAPRERAVPAAVPLPNSLHEVGDDQDPPRAKDQVIPDDLIVQGSTCTGFDCVNNETFSFVTLKLKENNLRVLFDDTTSSAGFPANDWQLVANDTASGGASFFAIEDVTAARPPFIVMAGAPANALFVSSTGRIGIGTGTPVLQQHLSQGDTPAVRYEQTNSSGFTAQTWDVAGNEANFFVRDVTGGSLLPFRIRPGAPTSSLDIDNTGNVGIGVADAVARLQVQANAPSAAPIPSFSVVNPSFGDRNPRFQVDSNGNVEARGTISQSSSRHAKWGFDAIDGERLLDKVRALPVTTWSYLASQTRHAGPVAEDFHAAFGLGESDRVIAPSDLAGVALAAVKALQQEVDERDRRIEALERRLLEIESRLPR